MTLSELFLFASASAGMTLIVVYGGIFAPIREAAGKAAKRFWFFPCFYFPSFSSTRRVRRDSNVPSFDSILSR